MRGIFRSNVIFIMNGSDFLPDGLQETQPGANGCFLRNYPRCIPLFFR